MKNDTDTIEINLAKTNASSEKYFVLFDKYIPTNVYTEDNNVLLFDICNEGCIELIVQKNPDATYFIYDNLENTDVAGLCDTLPELMPNTKFVFIDNKYDNVDLDKQFEYNLSGMKFDCIIMNPPYQRNLHLKILEKAIEHLKDDNSVCVNLSPDNWITNPFKMFEKEKIKRELPNKLGKYIIEHNIISQQDFNNIFNTNNYFGVGIVKFGKRITNFDCSKFNSTNALLLKILQKVYKMPSLRSKFTRRIDNTLFVPIRRRTHKTYNFCEYNNEQINAKDGILFNTEKQVLNFKKSIIETWLYKWLDKTEWDGSENSAEVPYFGNILNPRTGLKGYESEWTDEDFYTFFNITSEEQKIIEETMEKYK